MTERKTVLVPIADGTEEIEAVVMIDVLRRSGAEVTVASVDRLNIIASRKVKLTADCLIDDCKNQQFDLIALPGGMPGAEHLRDCAILADMLKQQRATGRLYAAICASPAVVLNAHGLLEGRKATCHPAFREKLPDQSAASRRVAVDANCITSQGPGTAMEFAIALVRCLFGDSRAEQVAEPMCFRT
ncbi:MAG TPA: DJ-1/PfpI family protein [Anaerohalosphaeraceae bacterium]|nr:DJ-1/PfpI family protein [Anaerohalosphaeraceae bacterium]HOL31657.1 DJ-1/PfpI family protein [Anaerohalosphaeraceae bacterium]HOM75394.1 DJ-1/PfpI family protein [Anaerohalosphaeraceae bacterium]HPO69587.1 DJ-1/PfpI family protein [Anaerohalosphaeraceae bacterium]HRV18998.1 DJ-1/PfpI family protein [Anaerohalosphaeraceae bacterium]